jgi:predicted nucleotidyltransferase
MARSGGSRQCSLTPAIELEADSHPTGKPPPLSLCCAQPNKIAGHLHMDDLALIELVVQRLRSEFNVDLLGVLAGGSRLRDEGDAHSDLDIVVVISRPQRRRWNVMMAGVEIEMFVNPLFQMRRYFEDERLSGRGQMPHLCATGRVVFDPEGMMASIQAQARCIWEAGPPPLSERERWEFRYHTADLLRDIEDVRVDDEETAAFLVAVLLEQIIDRHYRISGRWLHKRKRVLNDLGQWDVAASRLARQVCNGGVPISARCTAVRALADHVLAPLGGVMPLEWSTDWEPVEPAGEASCLVGPPVRKQRF